MHRRINSTSNSHPASQSPLSNSDTPTPSPSNEPDNLQQYTQRGPLPTPIEDAPLTITHPYMTSTYTPVTHMWAVINGLQCRVDFLEAAVFQGHPHHHMLTASRDDLHLPSPEQGDTTTTTPEMAIEIGREGEARLVRSSSLLYALH